MYKGIHLTASEDRIYGDSPEDGVIAKVYGNPELAKICAASPDLLFCLKNLNQAIDNYWNSGNKPDSLVSLIVRHQQLSERAIHKAETGIEMSNFPNFPL